MVTDKRRSGYSNTAAGLDASLWPTGSLNLQTFVARTETTGPGGDGTAARLGLDYETDRLGVRAQWIHIGPDTDAQMGFITRTDIDRYGGEVRLSRRPNVLGVRRVTLDLFGDYIASVRSGDRLDWYVGPYARVEWNSGETLSAYLQWGESFVDEAFDLADRLAVPVGDYRSDWRSVAFSTSNRRPVRLGISADWQDGYGGSLSAARAELAASLGAHLSTAFSYERSTAEIPSGSFVAHLVGTRLGYAFSTRTAASAYLQWNSLEENLIANLRFVYRHRPGSDLILAVNEERGIPGSPWTVAERHLALKVTYLARF
jgi:hypothetical protein